MATKQPSLQPITMAIDDVVKQLRALAETPMGVVRTPEQNRVAFEQERMADVLSHVRDLLETLCRAPSGATGFESYGSGGG